MLSRKGFLLLGRGYEGCYEGVVTVVVTRAVTRVEQKVVVVANVSLLAL